MSSSSSSSTWVYNILGQVSSQTHDIGANYTISGTYDAFSRPLTQTVPSNGGTETLTYNYNAMGALLSLTGTNTYISQINYSPSGQVEDQLLGNGLKQQSCYNATTLRLSSIRVYPGTLEDCVMTNPANARLNLSYQYQNNGNISEIVDATRSETLTYTYDELDRLDTVSGAYSLNHDYNPIGNITAKGTTNYTAYNASHKHAVASLSTGETYTYDANGNMITRVEGGLTYTQTFDAENRLISVTVSGQTTQFIYDGDGNLVKKVKPDNSKTIYVGGIYEVDKTSGGSVTRTVTYYPVAGAMRINSTLYYTLKDHLGSASVVTDSTGAIVSGSEQRYYPYGESRLTGTMLTDKLFTGQRDVGLGIYHYGARFYSPKLGRFLSPDTIVPGAANPQAYNRYSYVLGNPLKYTDPTGHSQCQTQEDCDDIGTTPMGTGNPHNGGGGDGGRDGCRHNDPDCQGDGEGKGFGVGPKIGPRPAEQPEPPINSFYWDTWTWFTKNGLIFIDYLSSYEDIINSSTPVYRQVKYAFGTGGLEAIIDGSIYGLKDRWLTSLTPTQRMARMGVVAIQSYGIDRLSNKAGVLGLVGGKAGEIAVQYVFSAAVSEHILPTTTYWAFSALNLGVPIDVSPLR
jgi:RHS repeat-associated protein